jgi:cell division protein FtsA
VYEGIAAAESVLSADERELGVCIADIGASTTELAVYFEGSIAHTSVLPIGGDHFTNDLAVGLHVSVEEAEQLKRLYGNCVVTSVPQLAEIEVGGTATGGLFATANGHPARMVRQRFLAEILEPRARELFTMLRDNLRNGGVLEALGAGCVLTGGGANLVGLLDNAESLLRVPARVGLPVPLSRMPPELAKPEFAAAIGMLLYTHRTQIRRMGEERGLKAKLRSIFAGSF